VIEGGGVPAGLLTADPWEFQAECVEAFVASWRAGGFSPVTIDNDTGLLERTLTALGRPAWEVTPEATRWSWCAQLEVRPMSNLPTTSLPRAGQQSHRVARCAGRLGAFRPSMWAAIWTAARRRGPSLVLQG
jgi:hypothetical protein